MARGVRRHLADEAADDGHGVTAVGHAGTPLARSLRCGAVDDSDEVICDDDSVFAFLRGVLGDEALLDDGRH